MSCIDDGCRYVWRAFLKVTSAVEKGTLCMTSWSRAYLACQMIDLFILVHRITTTTTESHWQALQTERAPS